LGHLFSFGVHYVIGPLKIATYIHVLRILHPPFHFGIFSASIYRVAQKGGTIPDVLNAISSTGLYGVLSRIISVKLRLRYKNGQMSGIEFDAFWP